MIQAADAANGTAMPLPSWLQQFHDRLDSAEQTFLQGGFLSCYHQLCALLDDLLALTTRQTQTLGQESDAHASGHTKPLVAAAAGKTQAGATASVSLVDHVCVVQCVCQATVTLALQCMYELKQVDELLAAFVQKYYDGSVLHMPYVVLTVYLQLCSSMQMYDTVCKDSVAYLKHYSQASQQDDDVTEHAQLTAKEYEKLVELLVFQGLLPLRLWKDAYQLVEQNQHLQPATAAAIKRRMQRMQKQQQSDDTVDKQVQRSKAPDSSSVKGVAAPTSTALTTSQGSRTSTTMQQHSTRTHSTEQLVKLWKHIQMYAGRNRQLLLAGCLLLLVLYRFASSKRMLSSAKWPMLDMAQRELRNLAHLAFSNMLGASISQTLSAM